jgi:hypothetical protein
MINCHNDNSFPMNKNYSTQLGDTDRFNQFRILLIVTVHILSTLLYFETAFWVIKYSTVFIKLLTNVENDTVFFRDSAHPKRYRNLANSATTNDKIRVSKGYPRSHSNHCRSLVFTTVNTLACSHVNTKLNGSYNHPHTPINAHNLCKITGHLFYINCVHLLVMWVIIVTIWGLSGKYPAIFNISRTGRVTLM